MYICIYTEYMSGGSVYDYLHKQKGVFKLPSLLKVAIDVSKGMTYLHQNKIIHRDLKAANLLMDENEVRDPATFSMSIKKFSVLMQTNICRNIPDTRFTLQVVKVADFGVARVISQSGVMTAETGTYRWMAPEVCTAIPKTCVCVRE